MRVCVCVRACVRACVCVCVFSGRGPVVVLERKSKQAILYGVQARTCVLCPYVCAGRASKAALSAHAQTEVDTP